MEWEVTEVEIVDKYALRVRFKDGSAGVIRFSPTFFRDGFSPLHEHAQFQQVQLVDGVVTWAGELDLAPDAMHKEIRQHGEWILT